MGGLLKIKKRDIIERKCKYDVNHDYFSIPNIQNCYWAGFIAADGYIRKQGRQFSLTLQRDDISHIHNLKNNLQYTGIVENFSTKHGLASKIEISSTKIVKCLINTFNIVNKKSLVLIPPFFLKEDQNLSFIKGFLDGNGGIYVDEKFHIEFSITSTITMNQFIKQNIDNLVPTINNFTNITVLKQPNLCRYKVHGARAYEILSIFNELPTRCLDRKWSKLELVRHKYEPNQVQL